MIENLNITTDGKVQNKLTGKWQKGEVNNCGYLRITHKKKRYFVHRLVAMRYIPNPLSLPQVNHIDGNKLNNNVNNLEWCTASENQRHVCDVLGKRIGELNNKSKTSNKQVEELRERYATGYYSQRELGIVFGLTQTGVGKIVNKVNRKH